MREAVAHLFPAVEKSLGLRVDAEKEARPVKKKSLLKRHPKKSFHETMVAVNREQSAARIECADLQ